MATRLMDTETPLTDMATRLMDTETPLTDMETPLMDTATLGQEESLTLDLVVVTLTTLGLVLSPTGLGEAGAALGVTQGAELASSLGQ